MPAIEGIERFEGAILHSSQVTGRDRLRDKRVVVVGGAKSAHDCASLAADHARSCTMVFRSPHWLAAAFQGDLDLPDQKTVHAEIEKVRAWSEEVFPRSGGGHVIGPYFIGFTDQLLRDMGVSRHRADNVLPEYFGRCHAERFAEIGAER